MSDWMTYTKWFEWLKAHARDGESVAAAAERLAVTYSFLDVYGSGDGYRNGKGCHVDMAKVMCLDGRNGTNSTRVHRAIRKYDLHELA